MLLHVAENTKMDNEVLARKSTHFQASSIDGIVTAVAAAAVAEVEAIAASLRCHCPPKVADKRRRRWVFGKMGGSSAFR
jgi:hypothetical protein